MLGARAPVLVPPGPRLQAATHNVQVRSDRRAEPMFKITGEVIRNGCQEEGCEEEGHEEEGREEEEVTDFWTWHVLGIGGLVPTNPHLFLCRAPSRNLRAMRSLARSWTKRWG